LTIMVGESTGDELDNEFDLDIRIDDTDPAESDRIHRALTYGTSCTMCCRGEGPPHTVGCTAFSCRTQNQCTNYSDCFCGD
jgi:hypothetical protein